MNQPMVRLSIDIPADQHMHLKMLATKKGISMREYIIESLAIREASEIDDFNLDEKTFRKALSKVRKDHKSLFKNLSKR